MDLLILIGLLQVFYFSPLKAGFQASWTVRLVSYFP